MLTLESSDVDGCALAPEPNLSLKSGSIANQLCYLAEVTYPVHLSYPSVNGYTNASYFPEVVWCGFHKTFVYTHGPGT